MQKRTKKPPVAVHTGPGKAQQNYRDDMDMNNIVRRYQSGQLAPGTTSQPRYADVSGVESYHEMLNKVTAAQQKWRQYPPQFRAKFGNDLSLYVDFCNKEENIPHLVELGVLDKNEITEEQYAKYFPEPELEPEKSEPTVPKTEK